MGSSKGGSTTQKTVAEPWKGAQPLLSQLVGQTGQMYNQGGMTFTPWSGPRVAPQSNMTQTGLQNTYNIATGGNSIAPMGTAAYGDLVSGAGINPALAQLKANTLADVIPAVSSRFANSGMLDSSMAADTIARSAAEAVAPIEYGAWESGQNRRLNALGMTPQMIDAQYADAGKLMGAGSYLDQYNQAALEGAMQNYNEVQQAPYEGLNRASQLGMGFGGLGGTSSAKGGRDPGALGTIGTLGSLGLMAYSLFSDRRLKVDIALIGKTEEGYNKYRYRYLWDGPEIERVGVMADEVPEEMTTELYGYKAVDYSRITL